MGHCGEHHANSGLPQDHKVKQEENKKWIFSATGKYHFIIQESITGMLRERT